MKTEFRFIPGSGLETLRKQEITPRTLKPEEVRIAVKAVSLNYRDLLIAKGEYPAPQDKAVVPCSDGFGVILEAGTDASKIFKTGDRVTGVFFPMWESGVATQEKVSVSVGSTIDGWLSQEICIHYKSVVKIPETLSSDTAATATCAGVTAWKAIVENAKLEKGQTVLIQGTGGVSAWALAISNVLGLNSIIITSDDEKAKKLVHKNNVTKIINYKKNPNWSEDVMKITNNKGVDLIFELGGKATINESLKSISFNGNIAVIGGLGGWIYEGFEYLQILTKCAKMEGVFVGSKKSLIDLIEFSDKNKIAPLISERFDFKDSPEAFKKLQDGNHMGKILININ